MAARKGIALPQEFLAAAAQGGLRQSVLLQYAMLQVGAQTKQPLVLQTLVFCQTDHDVPL